MPRTKIIQQHELLKPKTEALKAIAAIVKKTLGPGGLPILIQRLGQAIDGTPLGPRITKDGVSVAEQCASEDPIEDVVMQAIKAICAKTNQDAGDGTTTAIVLAEAIYNEFVEVLKNSPELNPQIIRLQVQAAAKEACKILDELAIPLVNEDDFSKVAAVATVSANGDSNVGDLIAKAYKHVGPTGVVTVEEGGVDTEIALVDGYQFNKGCLRPNDFFNNPTKTAYIAEDVYFLLYDGILNAPEKCVDILNELADTHNGAVPPLVVIANGFSGEIVQFFSIQRVELGMQICLVEGPHQTTVRTEYYEDLAAYLGGYRFGGTNRDLDHKNNTVEGYGKARKVVIEKYRTTIYDGLGLEAEKIARADILIEQRGAAESPYDAQVLNDRLSSLTSSIAKISVGGYTDIERKELYDRIEDSLNAARSALEEGVIPGGGAALYRIGNDLGFDTPGAEILGRALHSPFNQILANVGTVVLSEEELLHIRSDPFVTYDSVNMKIVDALLAGIIDPVKVTKAALMNAVSVATLLATTGGAIIKEKD